jgi:hypothetical protein
MNRGRGVALFVLYCLTQAPKCGTPFSSVPFLGFCCGAEVMLEVGIVENVVNGTYWLSKEGCSATVVFFVVFGKTNLS